MDTLRLSSADFRKLQAQSPAQASFGGVRAPNSFMGMRVVIDEAVPVGKAQIISGDFDPFKDLASSMNRATGAVKGLNSAMSRLKAGGHVIDGPDYRRPAPARSEPPAEQPESETNPEWGEF